ncbi:hypothetical protein [Leptolyngbya sp. NIES-2104]|uniref:hypothetical protein n=1 Tax=Leptolyngbya sp. NIES-2104 TaxID=1552121 RepID=UPI0006EC9AF0|nr:hypothetical protein [Leptolyngbya sp. NIES-2104]GAP98969.1 hypothetical protein NIES2104_55260 [Leptolyngbya sp. NIES-2104]
MKSQSLIRSTLFFGAVSFALPAIAQLTPNLPTSASSQENFQGRGVAQGSAFTRGRNANTRLTLERNNFSLEMTEPSGRGARLQYRGVISRRDNDANTPNSFTLNTRVQSFNSSANLRVLNNTAGTCRIEVFDARIISSTCNAVTGDSSSRFMGLEQF